MRENQLFAIRPILQFYKKCHEDHCVKNIQTRSFLWSLFLHINAKCGKYKPKKLCIWPKTLTAWKLSKYGIISSPYFPVFNPNTGKYGPEIIPYLDTFHAVTILGTLWRIGILYNISCCISKWLKEIWNKNFLLLGLGRKWLTFIFIISQNLLGLKMNFI